MKPKEFPIFGGIWHKRSYITIIHVKIFTIIIFKNLKKNWGIFNLNFSSIRKTKGIRKTKICPQMPKIGPQILARNRLNICPQYVKYQS
uniref:Uncharacterized protein n=1 Tax=Meloidogyne enterolobii TaxID=390850 RepID=A0A6V7U8X7_MELEN|nr:unnamed protein product [Meloidogyne enterolobii]